MPNVSVTLPSLLANLIGSPRTVSVDAPTVGQAIEAILRRHPSLRVHFYDDAGTLRRFVLCFVNDENAAWHDGLDTRLAEGDELTILQSVSGG